MIVNQGFALQCYDCMYLHETDCQRDGYKNKFKDCGELTVIEEMAGIEIVCVKLVYPGFRSNIVLRSCTRQGGRINPCTFLINTPKHCSVCDTDLCNRSHQTSESYTMILILLLIVLLNQKLNCWIKFKKNCKLSVLRIHPSFL